MDNIEQNQIRADSASAALLPFVTRRGCMERLRSHYDDMQALAGRLYPYFSSHPDKNVAGDYATRSAMCMGQFGVLREAIEAMERDERPDIVLTVAAAGYLYGELKGLEFTMMHLESERDGAGA